MLNHKQKKILRDEYNKEGYTRLMQQIIEYDYPIQLKKEVIDYINKLQRINPIEIIQEAPSDIADVISQFLGQTEINRLLSPIANDLSEHLYYKCDTTMDKIRDYKDAIEYKRMYDNFQSPNDLVGTQFRCDTCLNKNRCRQCKKDLSEWKKNYSPPIYNFEQHSSSPNEFDREMFLFDQQP